MGISKAPQAGYTVDGRSTQPAPGPLWLWINSRTHIWRLYERRAGTWRPIATGRTLARVPYPDAVVTRILDADQRGELTMRKRPPTGAVMSDARPGPFDAVAEGINLRRRHGEYRDTTEYLI